MLEAAAVAEPRLIINDYNNQPPFDSEVQASLTFNQTHQLA
jgi:hypothetical protein